MTFLGNQKTLRKIIDRSKCFQHPESLFRIAYLKTSFQIVSSDQILTFTNVTSINAKKYQKMTKIFIWRVLNMSMYKCNVSRKSKDAAKVRLFGDMVSAL